MREERMAWRHQRRMERRPARVYEIVLKENLKTEKRKFILYI